MNQLSKAPTVRIITLRLVLTAIAVVVALRHVWTDLFTIAYRDAEAGHIFLVPVVFAWLVWNRRDRIADLTGANNIVGALFIAVSLILHEVSLHYEFVAGWHLSAVLCLVGGLVLVAGTRFLTHFAPAAAVLVLLVPVPGIVRQQISIPLQLFSAATTEAILTPLGFEVSRAGCVLQVNGTPVAIAEACNGMRMLFAVALVVYAMAFSLPLNKRTRLALLLLSPLAALLLNFARVLVTVGMFGTCDLGIAQAFHDLNGWAIPFALMVGAFLVSERYCSSSFETPPSNPTAGTRYQPMAAGLGASMLFLVPIMHLDEPGAASPQQIQQHRTTVTQQIQAIPFAIDNWIGTEHALHAQEVELLHPLSSIRRTYRSLDSEQTITMTVIACEHARDLVGHEPGICMVGQGWEKTQADEVRWHFASSTIVGTNYRFRFVSSPGLETQVASILITPGRETSSNPSDVAAAASDFTRAEFGAIQVTLMMHQAVEPDEWQQLTQSFVAEVLPLTQHFQHCLNTP